MNVRCHWNLHKKCWSVKERSAPVRHAASLVLSGVTFKVWRGGWLRAVTDENRNVHAFACGVPIKRAPVNLRWKRVRYNPFIVSAFFLADEPTLMLVKSADYLLLKRDGSIYAGSKQ